MIAAFNQRDTYRCMEHFTKNCRLINPYVPILCGHTGLAQCYKAAHEQAHVFHLVYDVDSFFVLRADMAVTYTLAKIFDKDDVMIGTSR